MSMSSRSQQLIAHREGDSLFVAQTPARLRWEFNDLSTADGHLLRVVFHASLRAVDDPTEKKALSEMLLRGRAMVSSVDAQSHYQPVLADALGRLSKDHPVDYWLAENGRIQLGDAMKKAAKDVSFACGLEALAPFQVEVDSPTLKQQQSAAMQRALAEQQTAGRIEHFQRAVELLKQIESQRGQGGSAAVTAAINALGPGDRGAMLRTLLMAGSAKQLSTTLWAVAGPSLLRFDLTSDARPIESKPDTPLGPFRSVQAAIVDDHPQLLIGARDGVVLIDDFKVAASYRDGGVTTQQGFSSAILHAGRIVGTHSEAGVVVWELGQTNSPTVAVRPEQLGGSPRYVQPLTNSCVVFAVAGQLMSLDFDGTLSPIGEPAHVGVVSLIAEDQRILAVYDDGTLKAMDRYTRQLVKLEHRSRAIGTAARLPWLGGNRLLIGSDDGAIDCVGTDDDVVTQYQSPYRGVRRIVASLSHVAALSADRGRLIVWNTWDGKTPAKEFPLVGITPHRAADLLLT